MNGLDPEAWLADATIRITDHLIAKLDEPLSWSWRPQRPGTIAAS